MQGKELVLAELDRILTGPAFRGSKRSQDFLRYVVLNALEGHPDRLKERFIGAEVFGRATDYDTSEDSIVRVKANEVRKRLAQHYQDLGSSEMVDIEMPSGTYVPEFRWKKPLPPEPPPAPQGWRIPWVRLQLRWSLPTLVALVLVIFLWRLVVARTSALDAFWEPVMKSPKPVLLCVAHPVVYQLAGQARDSLQGGSDGQTLVPLADISSDPDHYVGVGDALALSSLSTFLASASKPIQVRIGTDTSFTDLRNAPAVFIGAFTNRWTMQMTKGLRFVFDQDQGVSMIKDQMTPGGRWLDQHTDPPSDYVVISRLFDSRTGDLVIIAAGLGHYGTQMAGEFLTSPGYFEQAVQGAPTGWQHKNMQLVLKGDVIGKTPGPPKVVASHYW